ncbi:MAG: DUF222 domain-containing protein [Gammaproteobacteria bacterium]|nr:DUF222 domain-containing protein [Gammaproteobacteria bacterium]
MRPVIPIEELDRNILSLCTRINAATYELLVLIREFEGRGGHLKWSLESCAEWLAWRCDLTMTTALEKVRVARALKTLPSISASFSSGELSYTKVRAMTRVADATNEEELVAFALRHTATHVAGRCRELRMGDAASISLAERALANRSLRVRRDAGRDINLMLLCARHHALVHEGGFRIDKHFNDSWVFYRPDGIAVPDAGYHSRDWLDTDTGEVSTAYDNPPAGGLLSVAERSVREPPPPVYMH